MVDSVQELPSFRENLAQSRQKFIKQWMEEDLSKLVYNNNKEARQSCEKYREKQRMTCLKIEQTVQSSLKGKQALEERAKYLEALKTEVSMLDMKTKAMLKIEENVNKELKQTEDKCLELKSKLDSKKEQAEEELATLSIAGDVFREVMDLQLRKTPGGKLQFILESIDENEPEKAFYFFVKVQGADRHYVVSDCEPPLNDIEELVKKLNETGNLKSFVVAMRKRFKQITSNKRLKIAPN